MSAIPWRHGPRTAFAWLVLAGAVQCSRHDWLRAPAAADASAQPGDIVLRALPTTAPEIALSNLDGEIGDREKKARGGDSDVQLELVPRYLTRAQFCGRVADLVAADATSAEVVAAKPKDARAHSVRGKALSAIHEFAAATAELDEAVRLGADADEVAHARAAVLMAVGREDEAAALLPRRDDALPPDLVTRGALEALLGHAAESERLFEMARTRYRDVSPFAVAWMDFERWRALERSDSPVPARVYLTEATAVLPGYAHAVVHLAALEPPDRALTRLEALGRTADDPEVLAARADALRRAGRVQEATLAAARASVRFDEVLARLPRAFADHAAAFFLGMGRDAHRALDLAKGNAANRPTDEAVELWLTAAQAAGSHDETCEAATKATSLAHGSAALRDRARRVSRSCP